MFTVWCPHPPPAWLLQVLSRADSTEGAGKGFITGNTAQAVQALDLGTHPPQGLRSDTPSVCCADPDPAAAGRKWPWAPDGERPLGSSNVLATSDLPPSASVSRCCLFQRFGGAAGGRAVHWGGQCGVRKRDRQWSHHTHPLPLSRPTEGIPKRLQQLRAASTGKNHPCGPLRSTNSQKGRCPLPASG